MPKKKTDPQSPTELHVAHRSGKTKSGGTFKLIVALSNVKINGQEVDSEFVAEAFAAMISEAEEKL